ncbi:hypothetical protein D770_26470 [Flammeovirgaceae bacterium 311]|nr:hypothetical protein D770_26470 [Flammeovirgaceae bacterium 311]
MKIKADRFRLLFLLMVLMLSGSAYAQLPGLSQFWLAPQTNTPAALTGSDYAQFSSHYRRQAISEDLGYHSYVLSGSLPLYYKEGNRFGTAGLSLLHDRSGQFGLLTTNGLMASFSYETRLSTQHHLVGGLQAGYFNRGINWSKVRTDAQWQHGVYDPNAGVGENWTPERSGVLVINAGIGYHRLNQAGQNQLRIHLGASNLSKSSFDHLEGDREEPLPLGLTFFTDYVAYRNEYYELIPMLRWQWEAGLGDLHTGIMLKRALKAGGVEDNHLGLAILYSGQQTAIFSLQLIQPTFLFAIGYDLALGEAAPATRNAVEASLGWRFNRASSGK